MRTVGQPGQMQIVAPKPPKRVASHLKRCPRCSRVGKKLSERRGWCSTCGQGFPT